jgi:hypothetical protein
MGMMSSTESREMNTKKGRETKFVACVDQSILKRNHDAENVTLDCKITLTRGEWGGLLRKVKFDAVFDRIGMRSAGPKEKILAQIVAQHIGGER